MEKNATRNLYWNLGSCWWHNKIKDVQNLVNCFQPNFALVFQANLLKDTPLYQINICGYELVLQKTEQTLGYSQIVMVAKEGSSYQVLSNLLEDSISSIWDAKDAKLLGGRMQNC